MQNEALSKIPLNIWVMDTTKKNMSRVPPVTSLDTFENGGSAGGNYHPHGLFSVEIFGRPGSPVRMVAYGRIDMKARILKPFLYNNICQLKRLYKEILNGKGYARWNDVEKDFEAADMLTGETGYAFFMSKLPEIKFKTTDSSKRDQIIKVVTTNVKNGNAFTDAMLVLPAGLRDVFIEADGRVNEDEINSKYRALISASNALPDNYSDYEDRIFDNTRVSLQNAANAIFEYLWNILDGKNGFIYKKYYSRGIENGTRNVLSALDTRVDELGQDNGAKLNNTVMGLFQTMKGILPVMQNLILNGIMSKVFGGDEGRATLVNAETMRSEVISVDRKFKDNLFTPDGIAKGINNYFIRSNRFKPVMFKDTHYLALVYRGVVNGKKVFKVFNDISELPNDFDKRDVHPLTWCELYYIAGYRHFYNYPMMFTRYPVAGLGSSYVSYIYVKTTTAGDQRWELNDNWEIEYFEDDNNPVKFAYEYPQMDSSQFVETVSPSPSRLAGLGGDFDGDTGSSNCFYTIEAMEEISKYLNSALAYLNPKGGFLNSPMVETVELVLHALMSPA